MVNIVVCFLWDNIFVFLLFKVSNGESVQLDHDYCSGSGSEGLVQPPRNFYQTDVSDYTSSTYSRLPDYYVALAPQKALEPSKESMDWGEKNSKKDSGLESGDVSDASEEVPPPTKTMSMVSVLKRNHLPQNTSSVSTSNVNVTTVTGSGGSSNCSSSSSSSCYSSINSTTTDSSSQPAIINPQPIRKKKLNLQEYRSRREQRERIRSEEDSRTCSPDLSFDSSRSCNTSAANSGTVKIIIFYLSFFTV